MALMFVLMLAIPSVSKACKCNVEPAYPDIAVTRIAYAADVVFLGKVVGGTALKARGNGTLIFDVLTQWKGAENMQGTFEFSLNGTLCDIWYEKSEEVVVYGFGPNEDGTYQASICSQHTGTRNTDIETRILDTIGQIESTQKGIDYFSYGCGGGITATYPVSVIYRNGRITKSSRSLMTEEEQIPQVLESNKAFADELFGKLDEFNLEEMSRLQEPASFSCYFELAIDGRIYSSDWGGGTSEAPPEILELGHHLSSLTAK